MTAERQEPNHYETENSEYWPDETAARLAFFSFKFSQGNQELQTDFFKWLKLTYPNRKLPEDSSAIKQRSIELVLGFMRHAPRKHIDLVGKEDGMPDVPPAAEEMIIERELVAILTESWKGIDSNNEPAFEKESLFKEIRNLIIDQDYLFLRKFPNRPKAEARKNSHFFDYVIDLKKMGPPEFDQLHRELHDFHLANPVLDPEHERRLDKIRAKVLDGIEIEGDDTTEPLNDFSSF